MSQEAPRRNESALQTLIELALPNLEQKHWIELTGRELRIGDEVVKLKGVLLDSSSSNKRLRKIIQDLVKSRKLRSEQSKLWIPHRDSQLYYVADGTSDAEAVRNPSLIFNFYLLSRRLGNGKPMMGNNQFHFLKVIKTAEGDWEELRILDEPLGTNGIIVKALGQKAGLR